MAEPTPAPLTNNQLLTKIVELLEDIKGSVELLNEDLWGLNQLLYEVTEGHPNVPKSIFRRARRHD